MRTKQRGLFFTSKETYDNIHYVNLKEWFQLPLSQKDKQYNGVIDL